MHAKLSENEARSKKKVNDDSLVSDLQIADPTSSLVRSWKRTKRKNPEAVEERSSVFIRKKLAIQVGMNFLKLIALSSLPDSLLQKMLNYSRSHDLVQCGKDSTSATRLPERNAFARLTDWVEISTEELWFLQHMLSSRKLLRMSGLSKLIFFQSREQILDELVFAQQKTRKLEVELETLQKNEDKFEFSHWEQLQEVKSQLGKFHAQTLVLQEMLEAKDFLPNF